MGTRSGDDRPHEVIQRQVHQRGALHLAVVARVTRHTDSVAGACVSPIDGRVLAR